MQETEKPVMPCDELCPKCGSSDIFRQWMKQGERFEDVRSQQPPASFGRYRVWKAEREHIHNRCGCCKYWWAADIRSA